ncbi:unnamed protein product [Aureobasidium vineae]|uniref:Uncharacterized protein n=1 Tax=Aureobasidium vineae TaxID=2773715 RepID=A0A9N8P793_9PEZI|nr:unnamed protein product [Aureobasidium vineae]
MTTFTEREQKLMAAACQSFEGEPKLDMDKFAQLSGLAVGSARNAWAALKKKLYAHDSTAIKATPIKASATKSGKKRPPLLFCPQRQRLGRRGSKKTANSDDEDKQKKEEEEDEGYVKVKNEAADEDFEEV